MNYSCHSDLEMKESRKWSEKRTSGRERRKLGSIHEYLLQKGTQKAKAETVCKTWWKPENWETPSENRSTSLNTITLKLMHFHSSSSQLPHSDTSTFEGDFQNLTGCRRNFRSKMFSILKYLFVVNKWHPGCRCPGCEG